jgi:DNA-directed RNA polymerase subunit K
MLYTRFERARILGARALQISLGAPVLEGDPSRLIDPLELATREFDATLLPISVQRLRDAPD